MLVDFRPHAKLSGTSPLDLMTSLAPVVEALREVSTDLGKVRLVCDWVQYKSNFREVVDVRPILLCPQLSAGPGPAIVPLGVRDDAIEIAVDVRRSAGMSLEEVTAALRRQRERVRVPLEDWGPGSGSCVWEFNARYWKDLGLWEKSTGRGYEQALPGGESDAHNHDAARDVIRDLFEVWDALADGDALPEELYVVELGVGNGGQAKVFLDEFRALDAEHGRDYYRRLHYMMCDYSQHVLDLAREAVGEHRARISSFVLDATAPCTSLGFLKYKVFLVYVSNVYDNLPTDEVVQLGGRTYCVQVRAYLDDAGVAGLAESAGVTVDELPVLVRKLLRLGPGLLAEADPARFADVDAAVAFWRAVWDLVRLEERYVPLAGLDLYALAPEMSGELLRPLLESGADIRMHVNNGAVASFADSLRLLHPFGRLVCHDLFVTDVQAYRTDFRGPGKYEGSVVNWVNGPLLAHVGRRNGFDVHYAPFAHRVGGNIVTMTAQVRD
ncbi:hypothetical protein E1267_05485 [Nonomuraea longispora]|uniref:Uncharacterized protein n=1 Tax=Nonomuraea longispora TaxID=1848320 RepID=A0A4R4NQ72_9ACTN|nr:hypothetical protein [Nonomuraea longispora]TDC10073.1 hypothetical protein E1267_05485 [Nonomuraea longispora]